MSQSIHRHWLMLQEIPRSPNRIDAATIQSKLSRLGYEVSKRSVERDLSKLAQSGVFPIEKDDRSKPYGWYWPRNVKPVNIPSMDSLTALAYVLLEQHSANLIPESLVGCINPYFNHARSVLKETNFNKYVSWPEKIRLLDRGPIQKPPQVNQEIARSVQDALLGEAKLELIYLPRSATDAIKYEANPLALVFKAGVVYLVCSLWEYEDIKLLALHRIHKAKKLSSRIRRASDFDLDDYIEKGHLSFSRSQREIRLKARVSDFMALHLSEQPLSGDQRIIQRRNGSQELSATIPDSDELRWWILSFGTGIEVLKPASLRKEIGETAAAITKVYQE